MTIFWTILVFAFVVATLGVVFYAVTHISRLREDEHVEHGVVVDDGFRSL